MGDKNFLKNFGGGSVKSQATKDEEFWQAVDEILPQDLTQNQLAERAESARRIKEIAEHKEIYCSVPYEKSQYTENAQRLNREKWTPEARLEQAERIRKINKMKAGLKKKSYKPLPA